MKERLDIAINGNGTIGNLVARAVIDDDELNLTAINIGKPMNVQDAAERFQFDTFYGPLGGHDVCYDDTSFIIDGGSRIALRGFRSLAEADWQGLGRGDDLTVIESTGAFLTTEDVQGHLDAGAKRVIITAPAKDTVTPTLVLGVNDTPEYIEKLKEEKVVAVSSCSTNAIAPVLKVISNNFDLRSGTANIVHAYTNSQPALDSRGKDTAARRSLTNINPASTGSAKEVARLIDIDFFQARSMRVPVAIGSVAMLALIVEGHILADDVRETLEEAATTTHDGIIGISKHEMFSSRVSGRKESSVIDLNQITAGKSGNTTIIGIDAWFDNQGGYIHRVLDVTKAVGNRA